jgi:hypothetical protein
MKLTRERTFFSHILRNVYQVSLAIRDGERTNERKNQAASARERDLREREREREREVSIGCGIGDGESKDQGEEGI